MCIIHQTAECISGCFSVLWPGRRLGSEAVSRTQVSLTPLIIRLNVLVKVATSLDNCELSCNNTESCTAFSFGWVDRILNIKGYAENKVIILLKGVKKIISVESHVSSINAYKMLSVTVTSITISSLEYWN